MSVTFNNDWDGLLKDEFNKPYYLKLRNFLIDEYKTQVIYPNKYNIFNALRYTPYNKVKVVILGQDPYHGPNQAHGLSFSVQPGVTAPPSLRNIFKELYTDLGCFVPNNGFLQSWTEQGILLLNTVLTVRASKPNSHKGMGWENFTDEVIKLLNMRDKPIVFILWGSNAISKRKLLTNSIHYIIQSPHPSPLSAHRGFFGSKPFSKTNNFLNSIHIEPINWQIPNI